MRHFLLMTVFACTGAFASPGEDAVVEIIENEAESLLGEGTDGANRWWADYADSELSRVLETALTSSPELGAAWARIDLARAASMQAAAALQPAAQIQANATLSPTNTMGFGVFRSIMPDTSGYFAALEEALQAMNAGSGAPPFEFPDMSTDSSDDPNSFMQGSAVLAVSLPIDLMGQNTLLWQSSKHEVEASKGSQQAQALGLAASVAQAYYDAIAASANLVIVERQVKSQQDLLELVELSFEKGAARSTDVLQQRQQLATTEARLPMARQGRQLTLEGLRRIVGGPVGEISTNFPTVGDAPNVGDALSVLNARPDLQAAAHSFDAARLRRIAATRAYGPSLSIGAQVGWQYYQFQEFDSIETWGASANASLPVFSGGRIAGGVKAARANETVAEHNLRAAVLTALQEIRTAQVADQASAEQLNAIMRQNQAAQAAYQEARSQYQQGVISYLQVLPILIASQVAELAVNDAQRQRINARIQLHDALGGTWPASLTPHGAKP